MTQTTDNLWIPANWDAPSWIMAGITTRKHGFSQRPYNGFNLASHVGDNELHVRKNRIFLKEILNLKNEPIWLNQVHKNKVIRAISDKAPEADGIITDLPDLPCVILTADCVPLLICNYQGTRVGAIHVGWRGLVAGIIENAIRQFDTRSDDILVWIGPHIRDTHYEVGQDVYNACINIDAGLKSGFKAINQTHCYANLQMMVKYILRNHGINRIYTTPLCTFHARELFYSYRRDGITGRMASMIWMTG
jgi:YfiH family protein